MYSISRFLCVFVAHGTIFVLIRFCGIDATFQMQVFYYNMGTC